MDFNTARFNMVEQQIRPWDVLNFDLLDVLSDIPREHFVLPQQQGIAYADQALTLANGGAMLEPKIVARLIQALELTPKDKVLEIGTGSGYATAILAKMAASVTTVDIDPQQQQFAHTALTGLCIDNVHYETADGLADKITGAPFNAIYLGGSVPELPQTVIDQLADGGRLVAIIGEAPVMLAKRFERTGKELKETVLFETVVPALHSLAVQQPSAFRF
ncbi:protein-L-isoaspartate O-methyltransferase [Neisseriaceae bacterium ESL0693]|nr:protein-L-isoaspartate O-methyltransferase [Neisseriaceae bacterium ESL0693]